MRNMEPQGNKLLPPVDPIREAQSPPVSATISIISRIQMWGHVWGKRIQAP
jgi:hypothetical protein